MGPSWSVLPLALFCPERFQKSFANMLIQWKTIVHDSKSVPLTFKVWRVCSMPLKDMKFFTWSLDNVARSMRDMPPKIGLQRAGHPIFGSAFQKWLRSNSLDQNAGTS